MSISTTREADLSRCARCSTATVSLNDAVPWCPACEWNLDQYEPARRAPEFGWRWLDRRTHALAYRLTREQFRELAERTLACPPWSVARLVVVAASILLLAGVLALAAAGIWLLTIWTPVAVLFGVTTLCLAVARRRRTSSRFRRISTRTPLQSGCAADGCSASGCRCGGR